MKGARNLFGQGRVGFYYDLAMASTVFTEASPKGDAFLDEVGVMCVPGQNDANGETWASVHELVVYKDTNIRGLCGFHRFSHKRNMLAASFRRRHGQNALTRFRQRKYDLLCEPQRPVYGDFCQAA
jgi:hypothetical protein